MWIDAKGSAVLPTQECMRLLAVTAKESGFGRLGVSTDQAPVIIPVNFTLRDGQVWIRTGTGFVSRAATDHLVAFEVDCMDSVAGVAWSVLVRGLATTIDSPTDGDFALAPRPYVPEPGDMVLVLRPDVVTGRRFSFVERSEAL